MTFAFRFLPGFFALIAVVFAGCQPYRVEYRTRPEYYREAAVGGLPERQVLEDGTVLVYRTRDLYGTAKSSAGRQGETFKIREELPDGSIVLRALIPEHVIANLIECLDNEEYELIYEQLLSEHTRLEWEGLGHDVDDFAAHFAQNQAEMRRSLMRVYMGFAHLDTLIESHGNGVIEARLASHVAGSARFTRVRMIREGFGLKLLMIR